MKAVLLAGGQEFGQSPLSRQAPRALWPLIDRPVIEHVLRALHKAGIGDMAISANGRTHDISDRLGTHPAPGITIHYSEDPLPRGAAGCIKDCEGWLGKETFLVVNGASLLLDVDFQPLIEEHRKSGAVLTVAAAEETQPSNGVGESLSLKPAGIYVCEPAVCKYINTRGYQDMKEQLIPRLTEAGLKVRAVPLKGRVVPIRNEETYLNAMVEVLEDEMLQAQFTVSIDRRAPGLWIDPTAEIDPTARIVGPVYVGAGARIGADAVVIGPVIIGPGVEIGADAVVNESILWRGAKVGAGALVEQTVMAADSMVAGNVEVRGAIVVEKNLSAAERQSLGGSMDFGSADIPVKERWWRRVWSGFRSTVRAAGLDRAAAMLPTTAPARQVV